MRLRWRSRRIWDLHEGEVIRIGSLFRWHLKGQVLDCTPDPVHRRVDGHLTTLDGQVTSFTIRGRTLRRCQRLGTAHRDQLAAVLAGDETDHFVGIGDPQQPAGWITLERTIVAEKPEQPFSSLEDACLYILWAKNHGHEPFLEAPGDRTDFAAGRGRSPERGMADYAAAVDVAETPTVDAGTAVGAVRSDQEASRPWRTRPEPGN